MIQDTKIAVPPTNGVQLKMARIGAPPGSPDVAATSRWRATIDGSFDQGPVHATTTAMRIGDRQPSHADVAGRKAVRFRLWYRRSRRHRRKPTTCAGRHTLSSTNSAAKQTIAPITSGR